MSSPISKADAVFLKQFAIVIGLLALLVSGLVALAGFIYSSHPNPENPGAERVLLQRLAPVGGVYAGDTGHAAMAAAQEAAAKAAASAVAYGGSTDGAVIYEALCTSCHEVGVAGSPKRNDAAYWAAREAEIGLDALVRHAIDGYNGDHGVMPARGGNPALTDEQVQVTVNWMLANH